MNTSKLLASAKIIVLALIVAVGIRSISAAYITPPGTPPICPSGYGSCDAALNATAVAQLKTGSLSVNSDGSSVNRVGLYSFGQTVFDNSSLGGSAVNIADGKQTAGYVLTSDANGNATWAVPFGVVGSGAGAVITGTVNSSSTATITLPSGKWNVTVFMAYSNCIDNTVTMTFDATVIGSRTGYQDPKGCSDSVVSGSANGVTGGSHSLTIVGFDTSSEHGQQYWYWTATSGGVNVQPVSTGKVYWEQDNKNTNGDNRLHCEAGATGTGFCNSVGSDAVSIGCTDGNIIQNRILSTTYSNDWSYVHHVGYCVGAPN